MSESEANALECARRWLATGETEFMKFTPQEFLEQVTLEGQTLSISARNHIVRVEIRSLEGSRLTADNVGC